jgi:aryl-alcohol dehydrogenase-like predicted oxidoreductase
VGAGIRVPLGESGLRSFRSSSVPPSSAGTSISPPRILDAYHARGGNAVHTSDGYAAGRSEHIIGQWLQRRGIRDDIVVAVRVGANPDHPGLGPVNLIRAVEASLTRLHTDRIDVLYLDALSDDATTLEDTLATVEWLIESGRCAPWGLRPHGRPAGRGPDSRIGGLPAPHGAGRPVQHPSAVEFDGDLRLVASAQGIAVTPSQALEHGYLAGVHRDRAQVAYSVRGIQLAAAMNRRGSRTLRALDRIGDELSVPPSAVAIAWLLAQRAVVAPIVNVFAVAHVEELVQGVGARLSRSHLGEISRATQ